MVAAVAVLLPLIAEKAAHAMMVVMASLPCNGEPPVRG